MHPIDGRSDRVVINSNWGLGVSVVGGTVNPDTFIFDKLTLDIIERRIEVKSTKTMLSESGGVHTVAVPDTDRSKPSLTAQEATELAHLVAKLEQKMHFTVDVECALQNGKWHVLQCRPV